jgi:hypothetical protein
MMNLRLLGALVLALEVSCALGGCAGPASVGADAGQVSTAGTVDSGIRGSMTSAWGNPPANPPTYQCVRVFDATGKVLVAEGTCSGISGEFRVPLPAGTYLVEAGGRWENSTGQSLLKPERRTVKIQNGQWVEIAPHGPSGPVP